MLIVNQITWDYTTHHPTIRLYLNRFKTLLEKFERYEITKIPKKENNHANAFIEIASNVDYSLQWTIHFEYLENWMGETIDYIWEGKLQEDHNMAIKLILKASTYTVIYRKLYRCFYSGPHTLCTTSEFGLQILNDIHSRVYGNHARGRSVT